MLRTILLSLVSLSLVPFVTAFRPVTSGNITACERGTTSGKTILLSLKADKRTECQCKIRVVKPVSKKEDINFQLLNPRHDICGHKVVIFYPGKEYLKLLHCYNGMETLSVTNTRWIEVGFKSWSASKNINYSEQDLEISFTKKNSQNYLEVWCQGISPNWFPNDNGQGNLQITTPAEQYLMKDATEINYVPYIVGGVLSGVSVIVIVAIVIFRMIKRKTIYDQPSTNLPADHHPYSSVNDPEPIYSTIPDFYFAYARTHGTTHLPQPKTPPIPKRQISNRDSGVVGDFDLGEVRHIDNDGTVRQDLGDDDDTHDYLEVIP